tara:strand:- start:969 stop:1325 length:357 start_codon:yes stop_codon:yes gene_type:complete
VSQPLLLTYDSKTIGVVRNPYERLVALYQQSFDFIGFDNWIAKSKPELQTVLFKDCDYIIRFEAWEDELKFHNLHPKDTSILQDEQVTMMWDTWYTMKTKTLVYSIYRKDIETYGYSF